MPRTTERPVATEAVAGPSPDSFGAALSARRRVRYFSWLIGGTAALTAVGAAALTAAGLLRWAPLVLLVALPVAVRISDSVSRLFTVTLVRPTPAPPHLAGADLARAMAVTAVVYPAIVGSQADATTLLDGIRDNRAATGRGPALHLALVDFADGPHEHEDTDDALRQALIDGIAAMDGGPCPVAVLFRRRQWNPAQGVYMGWERKRGKLEELVALIGGRDDTSFLTDTDTATELVKLLRTLRYLVTVDVGDRLEPRAARRLVGVIAHPDNAAVVAPGLGLVVAGFGFARPISVPARPRTLFEWSIHPYKPLEGIPSPAQAAFGCDEFLGKGAIAVAAYQAVLVGAIPPNQVLSHDRLEGLHLRTAAVAEARIVEANVGDYLHFRARQHRWIRGDTHQLPWIVGRAGLTKLSATDRIGLARDILSHLYTPALTVLFAAAWLAAPTGQVGWWTAALLVLSALPLVPTALLPQLVGLQFAAAGQARRDVRRLVAVWRRTLPASRRLAVAETVRWLMSFALQLDMALVCGDAVLRACYRMFVSHRNVLRWTSSSQLARPGPGLTSRISRMWPTSLTAAGLAAATASLDPVRLLWAAPLLTLWLLTPVVAYVTSRPMERLPDLSVV